MKSYCRVLPFVLMLISFSINAIAQAPVIQSFSPTAGPVGTTVTVTGSNFNTTPANNIVFFGPVQAQVTSASATTLVLTIPAGAGYQPPSVLNTATHLTGYAAKPFDITFSTDNTFTNADFNNSLMLPTGTNPASVVSVMDIDGDGKPDLIVANASSNSVSIYHNTTLPGSSKITFDPKVDITGAQGPTGITMQDIDGDGKPDMIVTGMGIYIYRNTSVKGTINASSFDTPVLLSVSNGTGTGSAVFTDIDGDGKPDLLAFALQGAWISLLQNTSAPGGISFGPRYDFNITSSPAGIATGDLDGDGKPDVIVTGNNYNQGVFIFKNQSVNGTLNASSLGTQVFIPYSFDPGGATVTDMNADGKPDLVMAAGFGMNVFQNNTSGQAITASSFTNSGAYPPLYGDIALSVSDLNGDGKPDVVTSSSSNIEIYTNTAGSGAINSQFFANGAIFQTANQQVKVIAADVSGDGMPDLITSNFFENTLSIISHAAKPTNSIPNISYQTPQVYTVNSSISPLLPTNTGGAVPATVYGDVSTLAGSGTSGSTDGLGAAASFKVPKDIATDANGNIYVADNGANTIRKITPAGLVSTFAGTGNIGNTDGGPGIASFTNPSGLSIDATGNVFVADAGNQLIRKITPQGIVSTFAGNGQNGLNDGKANANFNFPNDVAVDASGNVYVSDYSNHEIRRITPDGTVHTFAGYPILGTADGTGPVARFYNPGGLTIDAKGNIYVADESNNLIRKMTPDSVVTTVAGTGARGSSDGAALSSSFFYPTNLTFDQAGNLYISDTFNSVIRKIDPSGTVSTFAGITGTYGFTNGDRSTATFNDPLGVVADNNGNLYVSDGGNFAIRKIVLTGYAIDKPLPQGLTFDATTGTISGTPTAAAPATDYTVTAYNLYGSSSAVVHITVNALLAAVQPPNISYQTPQVYMVNNAIAPLAPANTGGPVPANIYGQVSTYAGSGAMGSQNGPAASATFSYPYGIVSDAANNIYVSDANAFLIRKIATDGTVSTFASTGESGLSIDAANNIYVADQNERGIRKITPSGAVSVFAGSGNYGFNDGSATTASFSNPRGVAVDNTGNVYVSDSENNLIRKIAPDGTVGTYAGTGGGGSQDGPANLATFNDPFGIALDAAGNVYVADQGGNVIRKITVAGQVSTIAGTGAKASSNGNGTALNASFRALNAIAVDNSGNIFVNDYSNIREITPVGTISTLAGSLSAVGMVNGADADARFNALVGLAFGADGNLYATDEYNYSVRKINTTGYTIDKALPPGLVFDAATGIISGTPTVLSPATKYTITAYNKGGSSSTIVDLEITDGINLPAIPDKTLCSVDFDPGATGGSGVYTYTSSNSGVATIVAGRVHIVGSGNTIITVSDGSSSQTATMTVAPQVNPTLTVTPQFYSSCVGLSTTYTAIGVNIGVNPTFEWKVNAVTVGTNSPTYTSSTLKTGDQITCTVTDNSDCTTGPVTSNPVTLNVGAYVTPAVSITCSASGTVPSGTPVTFTATPTNGGTAPVYQWYLNGLAAGTNSPTYTSACFADGDEVSCMLTNQGGACLTTLTAHSGFITLSIGSPATVSIVASANNVFIKSPVTFTATVLNASSTPVYQWQVNSKNVGTNSPTFSSATLNNGDMITCTVIADGGCNVPAVSNGIQMIVVPFIKLTVPNTFTPNGDYINDLWEITNISAYPNCEVSVYNRYGVLVFHSKGYAKAWDGTYNGSKLPVGTYYYIIDLHNVNLPLMSGYVTIVR